MGSRTYLMIKEDVMPSQQDDKRQAAREVIDILHEISILLVSTYYASVRLRVRLKD
jgi:hypothetical protein